MADLNIRQHIPDAWAVNARCILCGFTPLTIVRKEQEADQINCPRCGLSIVLDESGKYACISCLPAALQGAGTTNWMKIPDLLDYLRRAYTSKLNPEPPVFKDFNSLDIDSLPIVESPSYNPFPIMNESNPVISDPAKNADDLAFRSKALMDLGNPPWKIKKILRDSKKYSDDQINAAIRSIETQEKQKANRGALRIGVILLIVMVTCGLITGTFMYLTSAFSTNIHQANQALKSASTQVSNVRAENPPVVPAELQTFVPPGVNIINVPTPYVVQLAPGNSNSQSGSTPIPAQPSGGTIIKRTQCPSAGKDAAALFGGNEKNWSLQQNQWVMLDNNGAVINLPQGMTAGYLVVNGGMEIKSVLGPAQMSNIYMVMISCN